MPERPGKAAILRAAISVMGEDGYEGASMRDMAARAGVSVAALYYHFPSKHDLLREFLDEAYDVTLARLDRRRAALDDQSPEAQLDSVIDTLIWSHLHDEFAQLASNVAFREYTRLNPPDRAAIEVKRKGLLDTVEGICAAMGSSNPREAARAITTLATSLVEPFPDMGRTVDEVIALYQGFARSLASS